MCIYIYRNVNPEFLIFILNKLKCSFKSYRYNKKFTNLNEVKTFKVFLYTLTVQWQTYNRDSYIS